MARPLRLELPGALYHVTSRGDRREDTYLDANDRQAWLSVLETVCRRFSWVVHAYCQMSNHYHLVVETPDGNLSRGMRQLNGLYTQGFNRGHGLVGHLFQGRYNAILVQKESYLLELSRYVVLNPVRARIVDDPADWPWSSCWAAIGRSETPARGAGVSSREPGSVLTFKQSACYTVGRLGVLAGGQAGRQPLNEGDSWVES